jgi:hypothetical protein
MQFLNRADKIFLTIATLVLAIFSYFLYDDSFLFHSLYQNKMAKIGSIYHTQNDVRLKSASTFAWIPAGQANDVHQKDSVFTGERSEVSIQLSDGSIINLKENSMVTLNSHDGEMSLDLKYGDFIGQLSEDSQLKVKAGDEEYAIKGEKSANNEKTILKLNKSRTGQLDVKLQQGAGSVQSTKETKKLEKNKGLALSGKQMQDLPHTVITLLGPASASFSQSKESDALPLTWQSSQRVPQFQVEVAKDPEFKNIVWKNRTTQEKINADVTSGPGTYFWRVKGVSSSGQNLGTSVAHNFKLLRFEIPRIISPEKDKPLVFEIKSGTPLDQQRAEFKIEWSVGDGTHRFHYQISQDDQFQILIKDNIVEGREIPSPSVPSGLYFVRVRSEKENDRYSGWSEVRPVKVTVNVEPRPLAPQLVKNKIDFDPAVALKRSPSSNPMPEIRWIKPENINNFKVQISKTSGFTDAKTYAAHGDRFEWSDYENGAHYFRVYAINDRSVSSLPSEMGIMRVNLAGPQLTPLKDLLVLGTDKNAPAPTKDVTINWNQVPNAKKYQVEVADSDDFKNAKKFEVASGSTPVTLPKPGKFNVRVQALNAEGKPISEFSKTQEFNYIYRVPLRTPALVEPFDKTTVFMQTDSEPFIWLEWKAVPNAIAYQLELSNTPDFKTTVLTTQSKTPRFLVKQKIPYGKIYWRVRAISESAEMSSEWAPNREFSILFRKNETFK